MEMPPEIEADPFADDGDRLCAFRSRPVPPQGDETALARRSSPHPEQGVHPEFAHRLRVERLHLDAKLLQRFEAIGELDRKEHVRRLIDEIAGQFDAFSDGEPILRGCSRCDSVACAYDEIGRFGAVIVRFFLARLVLVEAIAAQAEPKGEIGGRGAIPDCVGSLERNFDPLGAGQLAERKASEHYEVGRRLLLARGDANNQKSRRIEAGGRKDVERGTLRATKVGRLGRGAD